MHELISESLPFIYFVYGLSFFLSGYTILFQTMKLSTVGFAREIKYFGLFFLMHGLADWAPVFYHEQELVFSQQIMNVIYTLQLIFLTASFYFLFIYASKLLSTYNENKLIPLLPNISLAILIISSSILYINGDFNLWYLGAKFIARHFMGFPAILLTSYALKKESQLITNFYGKNSQRFLRVTYVTLFVYGLTILISHKAPFFPANVLNNDTFIEIFGFPIQVIRAVCGVISAYSMVVILEAFHKDFVHKFEEVEKQTTIYEERERISQDIHDGTMQSLFGIGLRLQHIDGLLNEGNTAEAKSQIQVTMQKVDETSQEIRSYITDLRTDPNNSELINDIKKIIEDFRLETGIDVHFNYKKMYSYDFTPEISSQLYFIVRETLNNIRKHAQASLVQIILVVYKGKLEYIIRDNGKGFECDNKEECQGKFKHCYGLSGIRKRVHSLKGFTSISSKKGHGTEVSVIIPLND